MWSSALGRSAHKDSLFYFFWGLYTFLQILDFHTIFWNYLNEIRIWKGLIGVRAESGRGLAYRRPHGPAWPQSAWAGLPSLSAHHAEARGHGGQAHRSDDSLLDPSQPATRSGVKATERERETLQTSFVGHGTRALAGCGRRWWWLHRWMGRWCGAAPVDEMHGDFRRDLHLAKGHLQHPCSRSSGTSWQCGIEGKRR
jgi:hypothetical protein